eukprot:1099336-Prymnesium_polylepis.1
MATISCHHLMALALARGKDLVGQRGEAPEHIQLYRICGGSFANAWCCSACVFSMLRITLLLHLSHSARLMVHLRPRANASDVETVAKAARSLGEAFCAWNALNAVLGEVGVKQ